MLAKSALDRVLKKRQVTMLDITKEVHLLQQRKHQLHTLEKIFCKHLGASKVQCGKAPHGSYLFGTPQPEWAIKYKRAQDALLYYKRAQDVLLIYKQARDVLLDYATIKAIYTKNERFEYFYGVVDSIAHKEAGKKAGDIFVMLAGIVKISLPIDIAQKIKSIASLQGVQEFLAQVLKDLKKPGAIPAS